MLISRDCKGFNQEPFDVTTSYNEILEPIPIEAKKVIPLMAEILHQLRLVVHPIIFKVFVHPRWCRISSINSMITRLLLSKVVIVSCEKHLGGPLLQSQGFHNTLGPKIFLTKALVTIS